MKKILTATAVCILSNTGLADFQAKWTITPTYQGGPIPPGLIRLASDGTSYVGSSYPGGLVLTKYSETGSVIWQRFVQNGSSRNFDVSPDGSVFVGSYLGNWQSKLAKLSSGTGSIVFEYTAPGVSNDGIAVDPQGRAYWVLEDEPPPSFIGVETIYRVRVFNGNGTKPVAPPAKLITGPNQLFRRLLPRPDGGVFFLSGYLAEYAHDSVRSALAYIFPNGTPSSFRYVGAVYNIGAANATGDLIGVSPVAAGNNRFTITRLESNNRLAGISKFDPGPITQATASFGPNGIVFRPFYSSGTALRTICHDNSPGFPVLWDRSYENEFLTDEYGLLYGFQFNRFGTTLARTEVAGQGRLLQLSARDGGIIAMTDINGVEETLAMNDSGGVLVEQQTVGPPTLSLLQLDSLKQLTVPSSSYVGGQSFQLTLRSYAGAPAARTVTLTSSSPSLQLPPNVSLPANATELVIPVTTSSVLATTAVTVTGKIPGVSADDRVDLKVTLTPN